MSNFELNDRAPDVTLLDLNNLPTPLSQIWRGGQNTLAVFLRHLG